MTQLSNLRIKWPYVTHLVDQGLATQLLPPREEERPGALVLARVQTIGRHTALEAPTGRRMALYPGDLFVAALGHRYATDQYEGHALCSGETGHILGIGGVCGAVVSKNDKMLDPTIVEWVGRIADDRGRALELSDFRLPAPFPAVSPRPRTLLSLGASMNAGKTTTAACTIRSLVQLGHRVVAAKLTGTACRKDLNYFEDAGALRVLDFTHGGHPSTSRCSRDELLTLATSLRHVLLAERPDYIVYEIADGIMQRETRILLEDAAFRSTIDAVTFAAPDALACESGVRLLRELGLPVVATSGPVSASPLGIAEAEAAAGLPCLSIPMILGGAMATVLDAAQAA